MLQAITGGGEEDSGALPALWPPIITMPEQQKQIRGSQNKEKKKEQRNEEKSKQR